MFVLTCFILFCAFIDKEQGRTKKSKSQCCGYPLSIFFIVVNEFCERFSYYGMRAVLVLYFRYFLRWDDDLATTIYHTFVALCYLTPILGAIVADSWLGKFKTIVYLSIVYTIGQAVMAVSAIHDITDSNQDGTPDNMTLHVALSMLGLFLIAVGTGGIKPCVAAFGGDQFQDHQEKQRSTFFSIFYLSINAGSLLSTLITPILRAQECGINSQQKCYPLAFGVPAALMAVALVVFIAGSSMYTKAAPKGNIMLEVCKCIGVTFCRHWFTHTPPSFLCLILSLQGSRWTLQATTMDGNFGAFIVQPDQMQTVNPILILVMVPIVDSVVYPLIKKCGLNFTPLKRMTVGMFMAGLAFVAAALVQVQIDETLPKFPSSSQAQVKFLNLENSPLSLTVDGNPFDLAAFQVYTQKHTHPTINCTHSISITITVLYSNVFFFFCYRATFTILGEMEQTCNYTMSLGFGSSFTLLIPSTFSFGPDCASTIQAIEDIKPNTIHMAWQIPQYFLMTSGEVVFSVTGLEFSYSQAPSNMKSVLQAGWLLTVAVGNIIVLIVAEAGQLPEQWAEYVLFASLLMCVCIIFSIMAYFYTYIDPAEIEARFSQPDYEDKEEKKKKNEVELSEKPEQLKQTKI
uniref:Solute carrier family 15 member 1 n=1 Tax=Astyanax mexicanus TaxID=7994 RepID=A0A8B9JMT5_ASTMX